MKLTLAKWDHTSRSSGGWIIREIPGLALIHTSYKGWIINPIIGNENPQQEKVWGKDWEVDIKALKLITDAIKAANQGHPTRRAALLALEAAIASNPENNLGEMLQ